MDDSEMKIIFVGSFNKNGKRGGTSTYLDSMEQFLTSRGIATEYLPEKSASQRSSYSSMMRIFISAFSHKMGAGTIIQTQRPDDLVPFKFIKRGVPTICVLHGDNLRKMKIKRKRSVYKAYRFLEIRGLKKADSVICVDDRTYRIYLKRYPWLKNKMTVIPVGIDTEHFKPMDKSKARASMNIPENAKVMLIAGRLEKEKNIGGAIKLVQRYLDDDNNILLVAGMGSENKALKQLSSKTKKAKIRFLGQVPFDKLPMVINAADVVLVTSLFEAGPLIIPEAQACGVPVVSTDVGRAKLFLPSSEYGAVLEKVDGEFAKKVIHYIEKDDVISKKARVDHSRNFSFEKTGRETLDLFSKQLEVVK